MIFELSEAQSLLRKNIHEFAMKELAPSAARWDATGEFPWESVRKMAAVGLTGLRLPQQCGGTDTDLISTGIAFEEVARFDLNCAIILCGCNITARVLLHAPDEIQNAWLPGIAQGERMIAFGATEPGTGSDIAAVRMRAERRGSAWVIDGEKSMITFAGVSGVFVVLVKTGAGDGLSCLLVEAGCPGMTVHDLAGFGWRATKWGNVAFEGVEVPVGNLIGREGEALTMLKSTVQEQRALTGLIALGAAEEALAGAIEHARTREVFGRPLGKFEGIQFRLADSFASLEASKLVCYRALDLIDREADGAGVWSAMANLLGGDAAFKAVNEVMDIYGGLGFSRELPVERYLRDIKGIQLSSATLRFEIGRGLLGKDFLPYA